MTMSSVPSTPSSSSYTTGQYAVGAIAILVLLVGIIVGAKLYFGSSSTTTDATVAKTKTPATPAKTADTSSAPSTPTTATSSTVPLASELKKLAELGAKQNGGVEYYYCNDLHCFRFEARRIAPDNKMETWVRDAATAAGKEGLTLQTITHVTLFSRDGKSFTSSLVEFNGEGKEGEALTGAAVLIRDGYSAEEVAGWAKRANETLSVITTAPPATPVTLLPASAPAAPVVQTRPLFEISATR